VVSGMVLLPTGASYAGKLMGHDKSVAPRFVSWLETGASGGDPYAQLFLGVVLSDYLDPAPQPQRAQALFLAAAKQGLPEAAYRAAVSMNELAPAQTNAADQRIRLLTQAARAGHAGASALLGEYYATGTYIPRDTSVAVTYFTQASDAGDLDARNNLAWILATYPDPMIRDGDQALALIRPLAMLYENWRHLDTMAAAYAELGEYEQAVATQTRALVLAQRNATQGSVIDLKQLEHMRERLQLYQRGQSFRESEETPVNDI